MIHIVFEANNVEVLSKAFELDPSMQGDILEIKDDFAVGPVVDIYDTYGYQLRRDWWQQLLEYTPYKDQLDLVDDKLTVFNLLKRLDRTPDEIEEIKEVAIQNIGAPSQDKPIAATEDNKELGNPDGQEDGKQSEEGVLYISDEIIEENNNIAIGADEVQLTESKLQEDKSEDPDITELHHEENILPALSEEPGLTTGSSAISIDSQENQPLSKKEAKAVKKAASHHKKEAKKKKEGPANEIAQEEVWIWMGQNQHDVCGYYWLMSQLKNYQGRIQVLYLNNLPFINEKGNIFYPTHLHQIQPKEFLKAKKLSRPITLSEFEVDPDEWKKLCSESALVRILEGGKKISSREESFYDKDLLGVVTPGFQKVSKVLFTALGKMKIQTGDVFLAWRIRKLIEEGKLESQGDWSKGWKEVDVKLVSDNTEQTNTDAKD